MSKISALDFAKNVEQNRQSLISHCLENGKAVSSAASLNEVVAANNTIENGQNGFKVEFRDIDGTLLAPVQYVQAGGSATVPSTNPTFDSDYLEFDYWAVSGGDSLSNITRDTLVMPQYKTKLDTTLNERPTYLICYFGGNTSALTPTLYIPTHNSTYIDWGDGSASEQVTANTIQHTYTQEGLYVIKVWGTSYAVGGNRNYGLFNTGGYSNSLLKAYLGEHKSGIGQYTFNGCFSLTNIVIPSSVTSLGQYTFNNCYSLTSIVLPSSVTSIEQAAFYSCYSLTNIVIPSSVTSLGQSAFSSCYSLTNIVIPSSVTSLGQGVFNNCYSLTNIVIPSNITSLGTTAFQYCYSLTNIVIPSNITSLGQGVFTGCYSLTSIVIPSNITSLGNNVFSSCYSLTSIVIPSSVTSIGNNVFSSCSSLTEITLPSGFNVAGLQLTDLPLSKDTLIDIANKLKDNTGLVAKTITFSSQKSRTQMNIIWLDANGAEVPYGTTGAVSLLEFITDKNWTVSFA